MVRSIRFVCPKYVAVVSCYTGVLLPAVAAWPKLQLAAVGLGQATAGVQLLALGVCPRSLRLLKIVVFAPNISRPWPAARPGTVKLHSTRNSLSLLLAANNARCGGHLAPATPAALNAHPPVSRMDSQIEQMHTITKSDGFHLFNTTRDCSLCCGHPHLTRLARTIWWAWRWVRSLV